MFLSLSLSLLGIDVTSIEQRIGRLAAHISLSECLVSFKALSKTLPDWFETYLAIASLKRAKLHSDHFSKSPPGSRETRQLI